MKKKLEVLFFFIFSFSVNSQIKLSLNKAIETAIKNGYNSKISLNNINAAKQKKWETIARGLPQIKAVINYQNWIQQQISLLPGEIVGGTKGTFVPVKFGTQQTINATLTLTQLIFDGSYLVGLKSSKTYLKISKQAKEKTDIETKEAVINAYGNILVVQKSIEIFEKNKKVLKKTLNETIKIYENGLIEQESIEQLQITLGVLESNLRKARRLKIISYQILNTLLGNKIETKIILSDSLDSLIFQNIDFNLLNTPFELSKHIDFKIASNNRESKLLLLKLEKSKSLPSVSAFINYGNLANSNEFNFFNKNQKWFDSSLIGVNLAIPIFSSFKRQSKVIQTKIELENEDIRLKEIKQKLKIQLENAKNEYQLSIENFETAKKNLKLAQRIEKKQKIKFFEGLSSSFDLFQAQNQLYSQQKNYIQSMLNVITKKAKLETAFNSQKK